MVPRVEVYSKDRCPYCVRAKSLLRGKGVEFEEINVSADPAAAREMIERSGRRTAPQIFVDGQHVGDSVQLLALEARGELDALLAGSPGPRKSAKRSLSAHEEPKVSKHEDIHDVVIVGSGPAGLTAAIYASRANLSPVVVEGLAAGGQLMTTTDVENYPGFPDGLLGPDMMELFRKQAARFGTAFVANDVTRVDLSSRPFRLAVGDQKLHSRSVIIATGATPRHLDVPGEKEYAGRGVSYCATCDGFFFREQPIVVVGGGDSAMEEALFLTRFGSSVTVVHRRDELRASKIMAERALAHDKIEFAWNSVVDEVLGDGQKVTAVRLRDVKAGALRTIECGGFFVAIGHVPNTQLFAGQLPMDEQGYLKVEGHGTHTTVPGVFVAGDVHDSVYRQAVTAAGEGCKAAIDCERWLESEGR